MNFIDLIMILATILGAAAVGLTCVLGLVVWMAGGKLDHGKHRRHA
jgi:hypothetical protein